MIAPILPDRPVQVTRAQLIDKMRVYAAQARSHAHSAPQGAETVAKTYDAVADELERLGAIADALPVLHLDDWERMRDAVNTIADDGARVLLRRLVNARVVTK